MLLDGVFIKANKLETIISDILDATEMDTSKFTLSPGLTQDLQIEDLLDSVVESHQLDVETSGLSLRYQKPEKPLPKIKGSRKHLDQVFNNLIDNAIKYTPAKNEKTGAKGKVLISATNDDKFIIVKVSDNGIGIPKGEIKNLCEKFARASNAKEMYADGTGLGLCPASI